MITRPAWVTVHRWTSLAILSFLFIAGLTGAPLAFNKELDRFLNPHWFEVEPGVAPLDPLELRATAERAEPRATVDRITLHQPRGESVAIQLIPRVDPATGRPYRLSFDQIFIDPFSGEVLGQRLRQSAALDRAHLMPTLLKVHYTLLLPSPWGKRLMGVVALIWTVNCVIGLYLTMPRFGPGAWRIWRRAWLLAASDALRRWTFDFHRATGLWTWLVLLILAFSGAWMNLATEVFEPASRRVLRYVDLVPAKSSADVRAGDMLDWPEARARGRALLAAHATKEGFEVVRESELALDRARGAFSYAVTSSLDIRKQGGQTRVAFDAFDGRELGFTHPHVASGNALTVWLTALHRVYVGGLAWQIIVGLTGIAVMVMSATGVSMWLLRRANKRAREQAKPARQAA